MRASPHVKTLIETPRVPASFWFMLAACALVRLAMWVEQDHLAVLAGGVDCLEFVGAETLVRERAGQTRVLVFGSSRIRDGVVPAVMAQELGLSANQVTNSGYRAGTVFDLSLMVRRRPAVMDGVDLVIVDAEPWSMNDLSTMSRRPHFLRYASLGERIDYRTGNMRDTVEAVGTFLVPYVADRRPLEDWFRTPFPTGLRPEPGFGERDTRYAPLEQAQLHISAFSFSSRMAKVWHDTIATLRARGIRILIVQPPAQSTYIAWIREHRQAAYQQYRDFIESLRAPGIVVRLYELPGEVGLNDDAFADYGHFTLRGAEHFTRHIVGVVQQSARSQTFARSAQQSQVITPPRAHSD